MTKSSKKSSKKKKCSKKPSAGGSSSPGYKGPPVPPARRPVCVIEIPVKTPAVQGLRKPPKRTKMVYIPPLGKRRSSAIASVRNRVLLTSEGSPQSSPRDQVFRVENPATPGPSNRRATPLSPCPTAKQTGDDLMLTDYSSEEEFLPFSILPHSEDHWEHFFKRVHKHVKDVREREVKLRSQDAAKAKVLVKQVESARRRADSLAVEHEGLIDEVEDLKQQLEKAEVEVKRLCLALGRNL
ncbi:hypothetical protein CPC08DRAFT_804715 [Agrocybe pediades]|nr:hypothetical protein CPC08DRAFT_804715 [Agrocybe pediades]